MKKYITNIITIAIIIIAQQTTAKTPQKNITLENKITTLKIKHIQINDATIQEAIKYIREISRKIDPKGEAINIILKPNPKNIKQQNNKKITLELDLVTLKTAINSLCQVAGLKYIIQDEIIIITDPKTYKNMMQNKIYTVNPAVFANKGIKR